MNIIKTTKEAFTIDLNVKNIVKIAMLSVLAFALMVLAFPLAAIFPFFLKIDLSDLPALLGGFALGPIAGIFIELIKNILNILIKGTDTGGVGELSNFIVGSAFIIPASLIYMRSKNKKSAIIGMIIGTITMTVVACFSNYFVIIPLYEQFMPIDQIIASAPNNAIVDLKTFILFAIVPFNIFKGILISLATHLIYKKLSPILHR